MAKRRCKHGKVKSGPRKGNCKKGKTSHKSTSGKSCRKVKGGGCLCGHKFAKRSRCK